MEYEASLLTGEASLLCPRSLTAPAQGQRHAFMIILLNSVFLSLHGDANAWRHDTEACHLTAGTARFWSRARIRASACVCRDVTFVVELKN